MSGSQTIKQTQGFLARSEVPFLDPHGLVIVGLDEPETPENWYAHCARLQDESDKDLGDYIADIWRAVGTGATTVDNIVQGYRDGNRIVVLDGRRTTRSARIVRSAQAQAGLALDERVKVRVVIHAGGPDDWYRINDGSHRSKPLSKLQEARSFLHLWRRFGENHARVAELKGCTVQTVRNQLRVQDASEKAQQLYNAGKFPLRELIKSVELPRAEQDKLLDQLEAAGSTGGAIASNGIAAAKRGERVTTNKTKMRSRGFLEKWRATLKKVDAVHRREIDPVDLLKFVLGGPVPRGLDEQVRESLEAAGWKAK